MRFGAGQCSELHSAATDVSRGIDALRQAVPALLISIIFVNPGSMEDTNISLLQWMAHHIALRVCITCHGSPECVSGYLYALMLLVNESVCCVVHACPGSETGSDSCGKGGASGS